MNRLKIDPQIIGRFIIAFVMVGGAFFLLWAFYMVVMLFRNGGVK